MNKYANKWLHRKITRWRSQFSCEPGVSFDHKELDLPSSTKSEAALELSATISSFAPWIGGPIGGVLSGISVKRKMSRVNDCLKVLASRVESIRDTVAEDFVRTEDFEDLLEQTLRRVADERIAEKRELFAVFLLNSIGKPDFPYERRLKLLKILEIFSSLVSACSRRCHKLLIHVDLTEVLDLSIRPYRNVFRTLRLKLTTSRESLSVWIWLRI